MKKKRKGQVALEFLMTYGWAFLIILVVIGAFIYFDVLNPTGTMGGRCVLSPGIYCSAYSIQEDQIQFEVRNDLNRRIEFDTGTTRVVGTIAGMGNYTNCEATPDEIPAGATALFACDVTDGTFNPGERYQGQIIIEYNFPDSSLQNRHTGTISGEII